MTEGDPEGRIFLSYPYTIDGFFFLLTTVFYLFIYFKISFHKSPEYAKMEFHIIGSAVVECLTRDQRAAGSSLNGINQLFETLEEKK